jgi:TolB protein
LTFTQTIISGKLSLFPKWRDAEQREFFYTEIGDIPTLYRANLYTGEKEKVLTSDGMLVCSDVSSDGKKLLLTMAPDDQPDIYMYHLETKKLTRITDYKGIDVNANFVDDDETIVFVSDRLGSPNIFSKTIGSNAVQQMVFKSGNNNFCTTYQNYIAYVSRDTQNEFGDNAFNIYLISTQTDYIRQLTTTGKNLFPRFSPSGDSMLYIKSYKNESALGIIRLGYNKSFLFPLKTGKLQAIDW